jgi:23S rRNA pseudouridine2457 synthase
MLQHRLSDPKHKEIKTYWVQVEGQPSDEDLAPLRLGVALTDFVTQAASVRIIDAPLTVVAKNTAHTRAQSHPHHLVGN